MEDQSISATLSTESKSLLNMVGIGVVEIVQNLDKYNSDNTSLLKQSIIRLNNLYSQVSQILNRRGLSCLDQVINKIIKSMSSIAILSIDKNYICSDVKDSKQNQVTVEEENYQMPVNYDQTVISNKRNNYLGGVSLYNENYFRGMQLLDRQKKANYNKKQRQKSIKQLMQQAIIQQLEHRTDVQYKMHKDDEIRMFIQKAKKEHQGISHVNQQGSIEQIMQFFEKTQLSANEFLRNTKDNLNRQLSNINIIPEIHKFSDEKSHQVNNKIQQLMKLVKKKYDELTKQLNDVKLLKIQKQNVQIHKNKECLDRNKEKKQQTNNCKTENDNIFQNIQNQVAHIQAKLYIANQQSKVKDEQIQKLKALIIRSEKTNKITKVGKVDKDNKFCCKQTQTTETNEILVVDNNDTFRTREKRITKHKTTIINPFVINGNITNQPEQTILKRQSQNKIVQEIKQPPIQQQSKTTLTHKTTDKNSNNQENNTHNHNIKKCSIEHQKQVILFDRTNNQRFKEQEIEKNKKKQKNSLIQHTIIIKDETIKQKVSLSKKHEGIQKQYKKSKQNYTLTQHMQYSMQILATSMKKQQRNFNSFNLYNIVIKPYTKKNSTNIVKTLNSSILSSTKNITSKNIDNQSYLIGNDVVQTDNNLPRKVINVKQKLKNSIMMKSHKIANIKPQQFSDQEYKNQRYKLKKQLSQLSNKGFRNFGHFSNKYQTKYQYHKDQSQVIPIIMNNIYNMLKENQKIFLDVNKSQAYSRFKSVVLQLKDKNSNIISDNIVNQVTQLLVKTTQVYQRKPQKVKHIHQEARQCPHLVKYFKILKGILEKNRSKQSKNKQCLSMHVQAIGQLDQTTKIINQEPNISSWQKNNTKFSNKHESFILSKKYNFNQYHKNKSKQNHKNMPIKLLLPNISN